MGRNRPIYRLVSESYVSPTRQVSTKSDDYYDLGCLRVRMCESLQQPSPLQGHRTSYAAKKMPEGLPRAELY